VSVLEEKGIPSIVQRTLIRPPQSRIGPATAEERANLIRQSPFAGRYDKMIDRESAHEILQARAEKLSTELAAASQAKEFEKAARRYEAANTPRPSNRQTLGEAIVKSAARSISSNLGKQIVRGLLGSLFKGR
jgi:DNA helicase HerA-like ATPase